ncbi:hypothetical protein F8O01_08085 [Pseudoclavibacter chungangensis]|uniref:Site-specific integrase n=1 Tax=Pseudoclavibacter chungangensis TaxID=587635 RepID=A0A7J5BUU4_9MICO|nr:hypothetical protein [Pseudoclavibacter chungangensis]KAB1657883.1 hypothetical protein F8O01_08085 [Pseudoclavibacter chungangensis]NYJ66511.1 hypothetical protein [Pseudoclavibacter chungangensis]
MITKQASGKYRVRIYAGGVEVTSKMFSRKQDATRWEQDQHLALRDGEFSKRVGKTLPFREIASKFLDTKNGVMNGQSLDTIRYAVTTYLPERISKLPAGKITPQMLERWYDEMLSAGYERSTVVRIRT